MIDQILGFYFNIYSLFFYAFSGNCSHKTTRKVLHHHTKNRKIPLIIFVKSLYTTWNQQLQLKYGCQTIRHIVMVTFEKKNALKTSTRVYFNHLLYACDYNTVQAFDMTCQQSKISQRWNPSKIFKYLSCLTFQTPFYLYYAMVDMLHFAKVDIKTFLNNVIPLTNTTDHYNTKDSTTIKIDSCLQ